MGWHDPKQRSKGIEVVGTDGFTGSGQPLLRS